jgi:putative CocE/NonD family hydrolase
VRRGFLGASLREALGFLDLHLADPEADTGTQPQSRSVRFFMGGRDEWRSAPAWPPPKALRCPLYLRDAAGPREGGLEPGGKLCWEPPTADETPARFESDPERPVPSVGGAFFTSRLWSRGDGAAEQRPLDGRSDLVRFTGEALEAEFEIAGSVRLVLHAHSDAEVADFTAKLVDLAPDGRALNLCEGILRQRRHADGSDSTGAEQAGRRGAQALEIDLWACAWRFARGHRIRLEVASASFPRFDRGAAGRDAPAGSEAQSPQSTRQTLFHDGDRPSHLLLPVIGAPPVPDASRPAPHAKGPPG